MTDGSLQAKAQEFAQELMDTVRGAVGAGCPPFQVTALGRRVSIRQNPDTGIVLTVDGDALLNLVVTMELDWDSANEFLAVQKSAIKVYPGERAQGQPLFRYEFARGLRSTDLPKAHIQVHAERVEIEDVLARAGTNTRRGRRRTQRDRHSLHELHLPVGGDRFRPSIEDVLQVLINELGVDGQQGWLESLQRGRHTWREIQTRAVVRDSPQIAAEVLRRLGYQVVEPAGGHPPQVQARMIDL